MMQRRDLKKFGRVHYVYRANLSEEGMMELLRTRSGILTVSAYSRTHWDLINNLDQVIVSTDNVDERSRIFRQIRMYSVNVPITGSNRFTRRQGHADFEYLVVEADYDGRLGLLRSPV